MSVLAAKVNLNDLKVMARLIQNGKIHSVIEKIYPLERTEEAMKYVSQSHASGKIVIKVQ